ncbi:MAG: ThiF family adenylyltransferase, partial [Verrucomicrobia bacterium]|nr:ThiF family adenylyltransferase [Verrucomicrobiota bacterium]
TWCYSSHPWPEAEMFALTPEPIIPPLLAAAGAGGFVTFDGRVRQEHGGRPVVALEYEAAEALAVPEGERLLAEARQRFGLLEAACVHRVGRLAVGESAVWIGVAAPHRREAFEACEWIIDQLKRRVPIWKKEHFADGDSGWVGTEVAPGEAPATPESYYSRQVRLREIGPAGQARLAGARVLVVGAGGLGCAALPYLAAAGIGTLGVCDDDRVEASNLHRQVLFGTRDVGRGKARLAARFAERLNPYITVRTHPERLTAESAPGLLQHYDLVLDCTDNFRAKFLLNDTAVAMNKVLVQASVHQFEGQIHLLDPAAGAGCLRCLWPETPAEGCVDHCADAGVLGVVPGVLGTLQAAQAIQHLLGFPVATRDSLLLVDLRTLAVTPLARRADPACPTCGSGTPRDEVEVDAGRDFTGWTVVDLREDHEARPGLELTGVTWEHRPLSQVDAWLGGLDRRRPCLLVCSRGIRSGQLARRLRGAGWTRIHSLAGGVALARRLAGADRTL